MAPAARALLDSFARDHGVPSVQVVRGCGTGFRHRARLAVRGRATSPKIGIFETGSHRVVDIPRCLVHHDLVNDVAHELRRAMLATGATPYSEDAHRGLIRYLQVVVERRSQAAQVVIVANDASARSIDRLSTALAERLGPRLHSLHFNGNPNRTNTILGPFWERLHGPEATEETIGGARVFFPPGAFGQSNLALADQVVECVHRSVPEGASILELYAGVGPIGLGLVERSRQVTFNEVAPESLRGLGLGISALPEGMRARTDVARGPATAAILRVREADLVIVDPPRKGLDAALRTALVETPPARLLYVSCGLSSFLEDAQALLETGKFRLTELTVFDLFPHTEHVETVARLDSVGTRAPTDPTTLATPAARFHFSKRDPGLSGAWGAPGTPKRSFPRTGWLSDSVANSWHQSVGGTSGGSSPGSIENVAKKKPVCEVGTREPPRRQAHPAIATA